MIQHDPDRNITMPFVGDEDDEIFQEFVRGTRGHETPTMKREMSKEEHADTTPALISFSKDGKNGYFDIIDGRFDYHGDIPVTDAAKLLFDSLVSHIDQCWLERARTKVLYHPI